LEDGEGRDAKEGNSASREQSTTKSDPHAQLHGGCATAGQESQDDPSAINFLQKTGKQLITSIQDHPIFAAATGFGTAAGAGAAFLCGRKKCYGTSKNFDARIEIVFVIVLYVHCVCLCFHPPTARIAS
jgi:hypothetical protein